MNSKKIGGVVAIVVGVVIILLAFYAKSRVAHAKETIGKSSGMFGDNPINRGISGALEGKVGEYDAPIMWSLIGGFVLVIAGTAFLICYRRR